MGLRLIRESSDTPSVTNVDDARMARYAYGGYNGYVQRKGSELSCVPNGKKLTVNSGVIVLQGWEVEIDSNGWSMQVSENNATPLYYTVYCEVNLSLEASASIMSSYENEKYPQIPSGDDLTATPNGIARIEICHFKAQSGVISNVQKVIEPIFYEKETIEKINVELKKLDNQKLNKDCILNNFEPNDYYGNPWKITEAGLYLFQAGDGDGVCDFLLNITDLNKFCRSGDVLRYHENGDCYSVFVYYDPKYRIVCADGFPSEVAYDNALLIIKY